MAFERRVVPATIPALSSLAGAAATLYLDFDGDYESSWGGYSNITTPAYDQDGNPSTFSDAEVASITQIWQYVAEDYAPFNVNVTTVEPPSFNNGEALRVVIGGNGSWTGGTYGGVSYVDSFTNSIPNVSFVFPDNLGNGNPKYAGDASSHEAGHAFGLQHQSKYDSNGALVQNYSTGTDGGLTAPLMGNSYYATRSLWWYGTSTSSTTYQDDMAVISRSTNGFGYRPDDHGNTAGSASPLTVSGTAASGDGIITQTTDVDVFSFSTGAGAGQLHRQHADAGQRPGAPGRAARRRRVDRDRLGDRHRRDELLGDRQHRPRGRLLSPLRRQRRRLRERRPLHRQRHGRAGGQPDQPADEPGRVDRLDLAGST